MFHLHRSCLPTVLGQDYIKVLRLKVVCTKLLTGEFLVRVHFVFPKNSLFLTKKASYFKSSFRRAD